MAIYVVNGRAIIFWKNLLKNQINRFLPSYIFVFEFQSSIIILSQGLIKGYVSVKRLLYLEYYSSFAIFGLDLSHILQLALFILNN